MANSSNDTQRDKLRRFYRWHARIYDATRWSFLFGRYALLRYVAAVITPRRVLEIGCGTGTNLLALAQRFPQAQLTGVDLSGEMLNVARRKLTPWMDRVTLLQQAYSAPLPDQFDLIVFSYSLSMMNPGWEQALQSARLNLSEHGLLAVVDFADTTHAAFRRWMALNHVRMEDQLLPALNTQFTAVRSEHHKVYAGFWRYLLFVGSKSTRTNFG